jgi:hypothetical protein
VKSQTLFPLSKNQVIIVIFIIFRSLLCFQTKREAAYFVVVLHDLNTVVIAIRGTETLEDVITDGLCKECSLTVDDLDGLIK